MLAHLSLDRQRECKHRCQAYGPTQLVSASLARCLALSAQNWFLRCSRCFGCLGRLPAPSMPSLCFKPASNGNNPPACLPASCCRIAPSAASTSTSVVKKLLSPTRLTARYRRATVLTIQVHTCLFEGMSAKETSSAQKPAADMFYCGDDSQPIVLTASAYNTIKDNLNSCPVDCSNSAASPNSTTFYWQVSDWSACSVPCNGGLKTRDVVCHSAVDGR